MTYLHKLARRLSLIWDSSPLVLALLSLAGCSPGEPRDFLSPTPGQPNNTPVAISVSPRLGTVQPGEAIQFSASGQNARGQEVAAVVDWFASGGTIRADGRFVADRIGRFQVVARLRSHPLIADSAMVASFRSPTDVLEIEVTPDEAQIQQGEWLKVTARASLANGSTTGSVPLAWSANGGSVDGSGWFTAPAEGDYLVVATAASGVSGAAAVKVKNPKRALEALAVSPRSVTLDVGQTRQFEITAAWNDGSNQPPQVLWSSTGGTVSNNGTYTAGATAGNYVVIARDKFGSLADTAFVVIREPTIVALDIVPGSVSLAPAASQQFSPMARMSDGSTRTVGVTWTASSGSVSPGGLYTAPTGTGTYRVTGAVTGTSFSDTASVLVSPGEATLTQIVLNPSSASVPAGLTVPFSVTALYSDGSTRTPAVQWTVTGGAVSAGGLYTAPATQGTYRVVSLEPESGKADTSAVTVTAPVLTHLVQNPAAVTLQPGAKQQFSVAGVRSDGSTGTPQVTWDATGGSVTSGGLYTAGSATGTFRLIARHTDGPADTSLVTIATPEPVLLGLEVGPGAVTLQPGGAKQFTVWGTWSDGGTATPLVNWMATGGTVSTAGLYTAPATTGTYRVIATQVGGPLRDTADVTVTGSAPTLASLTISPQTTILVAGGSRQFSVSGSWSDGSTGVPAVTWSATGGTVTNGGLYYAPGTGGTWQVTARQVDGSQSATATVTVEAPAALVSLAVTPDSVPLPPGQSKQFSAVGTYSNGSTGTPLATWSATGGSVSGSGLFTAGSTTGTFRVVGSSGSFADTAVVVIAASSPTLVALEVSPDPASVSTKGTVQFSALGRMSDGSTASVLVSWTAAGGTVSSAGLYTAGQTAGVFPVAAASGTLADTAWVTVSATTLVPVRVDLAPASVNMFTGGSQQFSLTATYGDGSSATAQGVFTATGGTITSAGLYTAGTAAGTFRVIGVLSGGTLADTAQVTITLAPPPGQYRVLASQDWRTYADKSQLQVGVEGGLNSCTSPDPDTGGTVCDPHLPKEAFYDLVPDPLFGKVIRYNGGPHLNTYKKNMPGRIAIHATSGLATSSPSGQGYTHVWVRQFVRFEPHWTTASVTGGQGGADYKAMFLRYYNSSARHEVKVGEGGRRLSHAGGNPGMTIIESGTLPIHNVQTINEQCKTSGWPSPDAWPMIWAPSSPGNPPCLPVGNGNGEWYEIVMHHKTEGARGEFSLYWRQYTVGSAVQPQPWKIEAQYAVAEAGQVWRPVFRYEMGVNRNRQWDDVMYLYWGPYEVVDGSQYPNPWGLP